VRIGGGLEPKTSVSLKGVAVNARSFLLALLPTISALCLLPTPSLVWPQSKETNVTTRGKSPERQKLYEEIANADRILFDAFNKRDLDKVKSSFTNDLEFYHDKDGLDSYEQTIAKIKKLFEQNNGLKRELVKGSLEVYPIKDYGAIAVGIHVFSHFENGEEERGTFKFVNIWRKDNGAWKVSRVISYDH
jgi:hypothetical protein